MANISSYNQLSSWNEDDDLLFVQQPDAPKKAHPSQVKQYVEAGDFEATGEVIDGHGNILDNMAKSSDVPAVSDRLTIDVKSITLGKNQSATIESNSERDYWSMLCICFIPGVGSLILGFTYYNGTSKVKDLMTGDDFTSNYVDFDLTARNLVVTSKNYTGYRFNFFRMPPYTI
jgi:hypothetical protein